MKAWQEVTGPAYDRIWERFNAAFPYFLGPNRGVMGLRKGDRIPEPIPSITWSMSNAIADRYVDPETRDVMLGVMEQDLNIKSLAAFRESTHSDQSLYVLDWQHPAYRFWPHLLVDGVDHDAWMVPVLPDGDYSIFLAEDFTFGMLGHPWENTICVFGTVLLAAFDHNRPAAFTTIVRRDGYPWQTGQDGVPEVNSITSEA